MPHSPKPLQDSVAKRECLTEKLLTRVSELAALVEENERDHRTQRALFRIADVTAAAENMEDFYSSLHNIVTDLTSTDAFFIALYHEQEHCVSFPYYVDNFDDVQTSEETPLHNRGMIPVEKCQHTLTWRVIRSNEMVRIIDVANSGVPSAGKTSQDWVGIPLRSDGKTIGVFTIQSYQPGFRYTDNEIEIMLYISQHIATGLQRRFDAEALQRANENLKRSASELAAANTRLKEQMEERERVNQRMVELSHQAGKAEIATGILHNVGNVLNSINVSAGLVEEIQRHSRISSLQKAADLLRDQSNLADFFANDQRGLVFSSYLSKLTTTLMDERNASSTELLTLKSHLDHVKTVVAMQQSYAGVSGLKERVSLPELFSDAEVLISSSLTRHEVEIVRDFEDLPPLMLEKQKLLQVIVNLLTNAKDSLTAGRTEGRMLKLHVRKIAEDRIQADVIDNGEGIPAENLINIFSHGFTTKIHGHGFGLHSCANAIREMGGNLTATSNGSGQGATFSIELPYEPAN